MPRETVPADTPTVGAEVVADLDESNVGPLVTKEQNKQKKRIKKREDNQTEELPKFKAIKKYNRRLREDSDSDSEHQRLSVTATISTRRIIRGTQRSAAKMASARIAVDEDVVDYYENPMLLVDSRVRKRFPTTTRSENDGWFIGAVDCYDTKTMYYKIIYEDGDEEDMTLQEVLRHRLED